MLRRVEGEERGATLLGTLGTGQSEPIVAAVSEAELETPLLPHDHPKWVKDALTVSQRAREVISRLRPIAVQIMTFWDHRIRSILVGNARISVDPSGSYRRE
ncbi:MAG: hypothetical protein M3Y21_03580 [Candidatus Eremiobacteraeota bacterium]|nr:hypothetical protein [Candidatus Eremiobacteraeota bacterium]